MIFADAIDLFLQLDFSSFLFMFWHFVLFDFSRYTLSVVAVITTALFRRKALAPAYEGPVSVLLVGHNEARGLRQSVLSLREQTMQDLQIVVINDGSTDNMAEAGKQLLQEGFIDTFVATGLRGGKASALNLGLHYCRHPIVVCADIDTSFDRDAIHHIIQPFADERVGVVSGNIGVRNCDDSLITALQGIQYFVSLSMGRRFTSMMDMLLIASGAFGAFRREAIVAVGGWDVGPGDDSNLTTKIRRAGWRVRFAHNAWCLTDVPNTLRGFINQRLRWNRSIIRNRLRKFRSVFNPFSKNFWIYDMLGAANILFYQVILSLSFVFYVCWLFWMYQEVAWIIIIIINAVYMIEDLLVFSVSCVVYKERDPLKLGPYVFGFWLFKGYFLRLIRLRAYLSELLFRHSYRDTFYPSKVRNSVEQF